MGRGQIERSERLARGYTFILEDASEAVRHSPIFAWPVITMLNELDQRSAMANIPLVIPQAAVPLGLALMALLISVRLITLGVRQEALPADVISSREIEH